MRGKALTDALREEIQTRDSAYETLLMIDEILHPLLESLKPKHTWDEDCGCAKKGKHEIRT